MSYIGQSPDTIVSRNSFDEFNYTATNAQTLFEGSDANSRTLAYNPGNIEVFLNGVRLEEADFTATTGTSVVLASGATTGDLISIKAIVVFEVGDAVSKSSGGTFSNNVSVTGTLTATSFSGNGGSLTGINTDLVDDTTPQLGGDLYVNGNYIRVVETATGSEGILFEDQSNAFGTVLYRNSSLHDFYIFNYDGNIRIANAADDKDVIISTDNGSGSSANYIVADGSTGEVKLYHYGTQKFATKSGGVEISGSKPVTIDGDSGKVATSGGTLELEAVGDNVSISGNTLNYTGSTGDAYLKVYTASASQGARGLTIGSGSENDWFIERSASNDDLKFYYNPSVRFQMGSSGQFGIGGANYGTAGQVLTSGGPSAAPSWQAGGGGDTDILTITTTSSNPSAPSSGSVNIYEDGSTLTFQNSRAGTGHYQMKMENSAGTFLFGVDGLGNAITSASGTMRAQYFYAVSNTSYYLAPALTSTSMVVAGNVGIGVTSPGTSLHIKDAITNPNTISTNMTIPASSNSMMAGPITLNATVTVPSGSTWTIV